jgi:polyphosphate kinase
MIHDDIKGLKSTSTHSIDAGGNDSFEGAVLFNRELSWLEFNRRVLEEAMDENLPVLERLKFLSIFSTNLDEFFMIRVSGIKEQIEEGVSDLSADGMTPAEQLREIGKRLRPMLKRQVAYLKETVLPELAAANITIEPYKSLNAKDKKKLDKYFRDNLFPILTPQSVDSSHPFPYISNLSVNIGLFIEPSRNVTQKNLKHLFRGKRFARIKLPPTLPRLIPISEKHGRFSLMEEVVAANAQALFPNMKTSEGYLFRVTRDADIELREDEAGDLMRTLERELQRRRFRFAVRLEVSESMPDKMLKLLVEGIGVTDQDVFKIGGFVDIPDLMQIYSLDRPLLKERPISAVHPSVLLEKKSIFEVLKKHDILLHHPFTSFNVVTDFLAEAAEDPDVQAIKICLYRTGKDSPIVNSLIRATQNGKQVTALVELKARFDEENNIEWARRLENEGVHVVYGINTLKTHSKVLLVVRREKDKLCRYIHFGTGNYNPTTARAYTDLGLLTADEEIGEDATSLFNFLTGYSQQDKYHRLLLAPLNLREKLTSLIRREKKHKLDGKPARIIVKVNSLTDELLIQELYDASQAGVEIDLIVRGICALRPGVKGLSSNVRVRSVVGRFLEHSRIFCFANGDSEEVYIGSADWMSRNLDRRVEIVLPIIDPEIKAYITGEILEFYLRDNQNARLLRPDGSYKKVSGDEPFDAQMAFVGRDIGA